MTINQILKKWKAFSSPNYEQQFYEIEHFQLDHFNTVIIEVIKLQHENERLKQTNNFIMQLKEEK